MKKTNVPILFSAFLFTLLTTAKLKAQSIERFVISSTGNYTTGGNVSVSSTLGEPTTATYTSGSIVLTQGFQQADNTDTTTGLGNIQATISWTIFPNPANSQTNLKLSEVPAGCTILLYNIAGQLIMERKLPQQKQPYTEPIDLNGLATSTYMLSVFSNRQLLATLPVQRID